MLTRSPRSTPRDLRTLANRRHLGRELGVGDGAGVARLALPVVGDLVAPARGHVAVEAVGGGVEGAAHEPLGEGQLPVEDRVPVGVPVEEVGRLAGPEALVVAVGLVVHRHVGDEGLLLEVLGRGEFAVLEVVRLDRRPVRRLVSHDRRAYPAPPIRGPGTPPSPDGSVRAAASVHPAAGLERLEVADVGPLGPLAAGRRPPGRRGRGPGGTRPGTGPTSAGGSWSTATSQVMSGRPRSSRGGRPGRGPGRCGPTPSTAGTPSTAVVSA